MQGKVPMDDAKKKYKDFETALKRLEEITEELESGESKLEKSIDLYTEGIEIAALCSKRLMEAEKKIMVLKEKNKKLVEEPFEDLSDGDSINNDA